MRLSTRRSRRGFGKHRLENTKAVLRLTSMMDIFTSLLLFLLKSFVAEGEVITPAPGVRLPESTSDTSPESAVVVAIMADTILLDGSYVARPSAPDAGEGLLIPALAERLVEARRQGESIAARRGDDADYTPRVAIQGDRDLPFDVLQRVMYTCNHSGYGDIALVVLGAS